MQWRILLKPKVLVRVGNWTPIVNTRESSRLVLYPKHVWVLILYNMCSWFFFYDFEYRELPRVSYGILCNVCYCTVLYCIVLCCTVLYCPVLHCSTLPLCMNQLTVNVNNNNNNNNIVKFSRTSVHILMIMIGTYVMVHFTSIIQL